MGLRRIKTVGGGAHTVCSPCNEHLLHTLNIQVWPQPRTPSFRRHPRFVLDCRNCRPTHSSAVAGGSSSSDIAKARWAATASIPVHLWMWACRAAARNLAGTPRAFAFASWRRTNPNVSCPIRPPTSTPRTTSLHRLAATSSGYTLPAFCGWRLFARQGPARVRPLAWAPRCEKGGTPTLCQRRLALLARMAVYLPALRSSESPPVASPHSCRGERRWWQHMRRLRGTCVRRPVQGRALRPQHPRGARRTVVAQFIQPPFAPTLAWGVRQRCA